MLLPRLSMCNRRRVSGNVKTETGGRSRRRRSIAGPDGVAVEAVVVAALTIALAAIDEANEDLVKINIEESGEAAGNHLHPAVGHALQVPRLLHPPLHLQLTE